MLKVGKRFSVILGVLALSLSTGTVMAASHDSVSGGSVRIIRHFEAFSPGVYNAGDGKRTIGYGHVITSGETLGSKPISEKEAFDLMVKDIRTRANIIPLVHTKRSQNELDALTSLCFNIGLTNFSGSEVLKKVNAGETEDAYEYFGHWRRSGSQILPGLIKRRFAELFIFADKSLDPSSSIVPSEQWGVEPMEKTDENWGRINSALRHEAVKCYQDYVAE